MEFTSTPTTYTLNNGGNSAITVTLSDGNGKTDSGKGVNYKTTSATTINATCYLNKNNGGNYVTNKDDGTYAGAKITVADGYKFVPSSVNAKLATGANISYQVVVNDGTSDIYTSSATTITDYNKNTAVNVDFTDAVSNIELTGESYIKIYYWLEGGSSNKYIVPLELTLTGEVQSDAPITPEITIATQPQGGTSVEFAPATAMTVVASASNGRTCTYQWQSASSENGEYTNIEKEATSASYNVSNTSLSDKWYHCIVSAEGCSPVTTDNVRYQVTGGSSTESHLTKIETNYTYTPDAALPARTMTSDGKILAVDGGSSYVNGFGLSFKTGRQIAFKVAAGATVTANLYNNGGDERTAVLATSPGHSYDVVQSQTVPNTGERTATLTFTPTTDATYYLCGVSDLYLQSLNISFGAPQSSEKTPTAVSGGTIDGTTITATEVAAANAGQAQTVTLTLPAGATASMQNDNGTGATITTEGVLTYNALAAGQNSSITIRITAEDGTTQDYTVNISTAAAAPVGEVRIGLTTVTSKTSKDPAAVNTFNEVTGITVTEAIGEGAIKYATGDKAVNAGSSEEYYSLYEFRHGTAYTQFQDNQYVGYKVDVADGKTFNVSSIDASIMASASMTWKVNIEDAVGNVLYSSNDVSIENYKSSDKGLTFNATTSETEHLQNLTGTFYVKAYYFFNGSGKYLCFPKLHLNGTVGDDEGEVIGSKNFDTGFGGATSDIVEIPDGSKVTINFTNHNNNDTQDVWNNWVAQLCTTEGTLHSNLRADAYHWVDGQSGVTTPHSWDDFPRKMNGSQVALTITRIGTQVYYHADITLNDGNKETIDFNETADLSSYGVRLTVDHSYITDFEALEPVEGHTLKVTPSGNTVAVAVDGHNVTTTATNGEGQRVPEGYPVTITTTAADGYVFKAYQNAPATGKTVVSKEAEGEPVYTYTLESLTADATITVKSESTSVLNYQPSVGRNIYSVQIANDAKDFHVASQKFSGDYDMLNYATISGGMTTLYNGNASSDDVMVYSAGKTVNLNGSSASYMKVQLLAGNTINTLQAGDVITFTGEGELNIKSDGDDLVTTTDKTYIVQASDVLDGKGVLYFYKNGAAQFNTLTITRPAVMHTVTFHSNNGSDPEQITTQDVEENVETALADNTFKGSTTAHSFVGWNTAADGSGTDYTAAQAVTLSADLDLYAQWFRFSAQGAQTPSLGENTNKNYQFVFATSKNISILASDFEVSSGNEDVATVTFAGINSVGPSVTVHGVSAGTTTITIRYKGASGFYTERTVPVEFTVTSSVTAYTVSFNAGANGKSKSESIPEESAGAGIVLPEVTPKPDKTFLGWATSEGATSVNVGYAGDIYMPKANTTLYAVYRSDNTIGSANTGFWQAFSKFIQLDEGKSYSATFTNRGGSEQSYLNWVLIATNNNIGHANDGSECGSNEYFALRADGNQWKGNIVGVQNGTTKMYRGNGDDIVEFTAENNADFITAMQNATVNFTASRVGNKVYVYVTTNCSNGQKYVETYVSGDINLSNPVYLSFTTEKSLITFSSEDASKSAYLVKATANGDGNVRLFSPQGADVNNFGMAAGSTVTFKAIPSTGYEFTNWTDNSSAVSTTKDYNATVNKTLDLTANFVAGNYNYTVNAVDGDGNILRQLATGSYTTGQTAVTVAYPQYIKIGTTLYNTPASAGEWYRNTFTPAKDNTVIEIKYNGTAVQDVVYYVEGEDIADATLATNGARASQGKMGYTTNITTFKPTCTLPAGVYQIFMRGVNGNSASRAVKFTDGTKELASFSIPQGTNYTANSAIFQIPEEKTIQFASEGSSESGLDWFYVKKYDVLNVTENGQRYNLTKENATNDGFFNSSTGTSNWATPNVNGQKYNLLDMKAGRTETIRVFGAKSFEVVVSNSSGTSRAYKVALNGGAYTTYHTDGTLSSSGIVQTNNQDGITEISITGGENNTVYPYQIIFYSADPPASLDVQRYEIKVAKTNAPITIHSNNGGAISNMQNSNESIVTASFTGGSDGTGTLTLNGLKAGEATLTFDIADGNNYVASTTTIKVVVKRQTLAMHYSPASYEWNKTTTADQPAWPNPINLIVEVLDDEDNVEKTLDASEIAALGLTYASDDESLVTVTNEGVISLKSNDKQGSAAAYAEFAGNITYNPTEANFAVNIIQGIVHKVQQGDKAAIGDEIVLKDTDGSTVLLTATFGGWKYNGKDKNGNTQTNTYAPDPTKPTSTKQDSWRDAISNADTAPIDGYEFANSGANDAQDEARSNTTAYGSTRYGWYHQPEYILQDIGDGKKMKVATRNFPYSLPVRGSYMTFEPTCNGILTIYILQNGAWNSYDGKTAAPDGTMPKNGTIIPGQFRPHSFYVIDSDGTPVNWYTDFHITTKQKITKEYKCIFSGETGYDAGDNTNIANWSEFSENMSENEKQQVHDKWTSGTRGAQGIVEMDNGSFLAVQKGIVKYTFYVAAGQTYYMFSNFSKLGYSGMNFVKDEAEKAQPSATLNLDEKVAYVQPVLNNEIGGNHVSEITIPQYKTINLTRSFTPNIWSSICLPFTMTEREVVENFGEGTELLIYDGLDYDANGYQVLHFVYHEIQSIIAGYPYLIKPTKPGITGITVNNKMINPDLELTQFSVDRYYVGNPYGPETSVHMPYTFTGFEGYCNGDENPFTMKAGDIYVYSSTGNLKKAEKTVKMRGYRAYIRSNTEENKAKRIAVSYNRFHDIIDEVEDEKVVTNIINIEYDADEDVVELHHQSLDGIYNINGQKMGCDLKTLPAGLYIINGKKVSIK